MIKCALLDKKIKIKNDNTYINNPILSYFNFLLRHNFKFEQIRPSLDDSHSFIRPEAYVREIHGNRQSNPK